MAELTIDPEELLGAVADFNHGDEERASDAGADRQRIGEFLENTGINGKAFSHIRSALKIKKEEQRLDWPRSMEAMLPIIANRIRGNSTMEMSLGGEWSGMTAEEVAEAIGEGEAGNAGTVEDLEDEDRDFQAAADQVYGGKKVTPIRGAVA
jgi:hypothetical protein